MNKKIRRILSLFLSFAVIFGMTVGFGGLTAAAAEDPITTPDGYLFLNGTISGYSGPGGAINIPSTINGEQVTAIADDAFTNCSKLTSVTIPSSITSIGQSAFNNAGLIGIIIPDTVTNIGNDAFANCFSLKSVIFRGLLAPVMGNNVFSGDIRAQIYYPQQDNITPIYTDSNWDDYNIAPYNPDTTYTVTYDGNSATSGIAPTTLTGLHMGENITMPGQGDLLDGSKDFKGWNISSYGDGDNYNPGDSFCVCGDTMLFANWIQFYSITIDSTIAHGSISVIEKSNNSVATTAKASDNLIVTVTPDSGYRLKNNSLKYSEDSSYSIGEDNGVYSFNMPPNDTTISATFESNSSDYDIDPDGAITAYYGAGGNITIPATVNNIPVTSIGNYAFGYYTNITGVVIPEGVTTIGNNAFGNCQNISSVALPSTLKTIGNYAFENNTKLTGVVIPEGVTTIGQYAFESCSKLSGVTLPSTLKTIGNYAFVYDNLETVHFPATVTSIGKRAFSDNHLDTAVFDGEAPIFGGSAFDNNTSGFRILYNAAISDFTAELDDYYKYSTIDSYPDPYTDELTAPDVIVYADGDTQNSVTKDLFLAASSLLGNHITWSSDTPAVVSDSGVVTRPSYISGDATVTMTATIGIISKQFTVKVLKNDPRSYTVIFMNNTTTYASQTATEETSLGSSNFPTDPAISGYTFKGWYTQPNGAGTQFTSTTNVTADTIVYAYWLSTNTGGSGSGSGSGSGGGSGGGSGSGSGSGSIPITPTPVTVTGTATTGSDGTTTTTAQIPVGDTNTTTTSNVVVNIGNVSVTAPSSVLSAALGGDPTGSLSLSQANSPSATQTAVIQVTANNNEIPVATLDLSLTHITASGITTAVHQLSGSITVTVKLTANQLAQITNVASAHLYYYDPTTGSLTDMNAKFDLTAGTVTFSTSHLSTYVITTNDMTAPVVSGVSNSFIYNVNKAITFNKGTATLDGEAFISGSTVSNEGKHTLVVTSLAGIATTVIFTIDKTAPVVLGITNGEISKVNKAISFSEGTAVLDGVSFTSGSTVSSEGKHTLTVTDAAGNITTITFVIDKTAPTLTVKAGKTAVKVGGISASNVTITARDLFDLTKTATLNGKAFAWPSNDCFTKDGKYVVTVKDPYGHSTTVTFTVDKTAPKIKAKKVKGGVSVTVTEANLSAETVTLNGKKIAWSGKYTKKGSYTVTVSDKAGHKSVSRFEIA